MKRSLVRVLSAAILVATAGAPSLARQPAENHPLSGPKVNDNSAPGVNPTLDGGERDRRNRGGERNRPMLFMGAVMSLARPDTPEALRLTDEQREQARAIGEEYAQALRAFRDEHRDEMDELRDGRERRGRGERQGRPQRPEDLTPEQQEKASKLRALMEQAPKPEPYQTRMWALLSPEQQALASERLEEMKSRGADPMRERGRDGDRRRRGAQRGDAPPPPPGDRSDAPRRGPQADGRFAPRAERFGAPPPPPDDRRPATIEDLRARLERLPPEQRERVIRRLMQALDRLEERAPRDLPPPPMGDVEVPPGA